MSQTYTANFFINPPIFIKVVEKDKGIELDLGLEISGSYSYEISDDIAFFSKGGDLTNPQKKAEFEGRLLQSMHCTMSIFFGEKIPAGIAHDDIPTLLDDLLVYVLSDLRGGFCKTNGIYISDFSFDSTRINSEDEDKYRLAVLEYNSLNNVPGANDNFDTVSKTTENKKLPPKTKFKWECPCGRLNETNFCPGCGKPKDATSVSWICTCGKKNITRFCTNCGTRRD